MSAGRPLSQPGGRPAAATLSPAAAGSLRPAHAAAAGLLALAALLGAAQARAQPAQGASAPAEVSPVTITGVRPQGEPCPAASNGTSGLGCAGARLDQAAKAAQAQAQQSPTRLAPSAGSPDVAVGVVNTTALAQQFGSNLGKSIHPYRPAPPPQAPSPFTRRP